MIFLNKELEKILEIMKKEDMRSALDLGCGKGRFSIPLLKNNIKVQGVDTRKPNINSENFNFKEEDVRIFKFKKKYDLIMCSLVLHFFKKEESKNLVERIKANTNQNGLNLLICMSNKDNFSKGNSSNFYPSMKELKDLYQRWQILLEKQDTTPLENHDNLGPHRHNLIIFLVKNAK